MLHVMEMNVHATCQKELPQCSAGGGLRSFTAILQSPRIWLQYAKYLQNMSCYKNQKQEWLMDVGPGLNLCFIEDGKENVWVFFCKVPF